MTSEGPARLDAGYFDQWYADMAVSPVRDALMARALGLPPHLLSTSGLTGAGIGELTDELRLAPGDRLLDIGCGRGGYGIEVARRTGARLVGVDFSAVALEQARSTSRRQLPEGRSEFHVGTLDATGLAEGLADGLMCVDAVQFATPPLAAVREFRRVLRSGGRVGLTCWEAVDSADSRVPARIHRVNLERDLTEAGFVDIEVRDKAEWRAAERALWEAALAVAEPDDAVRSLQVEGRRSLATFDAMRRVFATATAP